MPTARRPQSPRLPLSPVQTASPCSLCVPPRAGKHTQRAFASPPAGVFCRAESRPTIAKEKGSTMTATEARAGAAPAAAPSKSKPGSKDDHLALVAHLMRRAGVGASRDELEAIAAKPY